MINRETAIMLASALASTIAIGVAVHNNNQTKKVIEEKDTIERMLREKIDMGIDDIIRRDTIDISEKVVSAAVDKAADNAIKTYGKQAVTAAGNKVLNEIDNAVDQAIIDMKEDIAPEVKKRLENKASKISIDEIKTEVISKVADEAESKIQAEMDQIVLKHQQQLDSLQQIYNNIGEAMKGGTNVVQVEA